MRFAGCGLLCSLAVLLALPGCDHRKNDSFLLHNVVTDYMVTPTFAVAYRAQHGGYLELEPPAGGYELVRVAYGEPNARHTALAEMNGDTGWTYYHWMPANFPALAYPLALQCYAPKRVAAGDTIWESVADSLLVCYKSYRPAVQWLRAGHDWYSLQNHESLIEKRLSEATREDFALVIGGHITLHPILPYRLRGRYRLVVDPGDGRSSQELRVSVE